MTCTICPRYLHALFRATTPLFKCLLPRKIHYNGDNILPLTLKEEKRYSID